jgi:hypothetical protein
MTESQGQPITSPPSKTAGEQDHSDPEKFRGEPADAPQNPQAETGAPPVEGDSEGGATD